MRLFARFGVLFVCAGVLLAADDPREIVRRSTEENRRNEKLAETYTFIERQEERNLDSHGRVEHRTVRTFDITLTEGSPYRRLVARDDKPLPPNESARNSRSSRRASRSGALRRRSSARSDSLTGAGPASTTASSCARFPTPSTSAWPAKRPWMAGECT